MKTLNTGTEKFFEEEVGFNFTTVSKLPHSSGNTCSNHNSNSISLSAIKAIKYLCPTLSLSHIPRGTPVILTCRCCKTSSCLLAVKEERTITFPVWETGKKTDDTVISRYEKRYFLFSMFCMDFYQNKVSEICAASPPTPYLKISLSRG